MSQAISITFYELTEGFLSKPCEGILAIVKRWTST